MNERRYPIGIQTFSEIIRKGYLYADKTDLVWDMVHYAKFVFLSRPRRFGKSLLSSTLESYFQGDKALFEGLKIMSLEQDWKKYPVLHFDLSTAKHLPLNGVIAELGNQVARYERIYGADVSEVSPGMRFGGVIRRAYEQTGEQVAVIVDEYDAPILDVLSDEDSLRDVREALQEFYQRLKQYEPCIRFCFITGITKFSQLSIFSTINNLTNVSMDPRFGAICGITEEELKEVFREDIASLASSLGYAQEHVLEKLKFQYDGYHFSRNSAGVYNPFSLLKCFAQQEFSNWWFESGTPTFLIRQMEHFRTDITSLDRLEVPASAFDQPTENMQDALPLLYQTGYLTIKDYDPEIQSYTLSFPNQEVRVGFVEGLLPVYTGLKVSDVQMGFAARFWKALKRNDIDLAMREMQAYLAGIPYVEGFKKKLADAATAEGFYEYTFYLIFSMLNVYVRTQVKCAGGRIDMVTCMPDITYVFEFKVSGTAKDALAQIDDCSYGIPFQTAGRGVVKVGGKINPETRTIEDWTSSMSRA